MILLNKPKYLTSYQTILRFKEQNIDYQDSKLGYVGTLDPMATGLLIVLEDNENKERKNYIGLNKIYEFEILFGIDTDTNDLLGIIETIDKKANVLSQDINIKNFVGSYKQKYPKYSAKIINGKRMYNLSRNNKLLESEIPTYNREIYNLKLLGKEMITTEELLDNVKIATENVVGDFRQDKIYQSWQSNSEKLNQSYLLIKLQATVSSGTYIRQLCVDIAKNLKTVALAYSINRTKIGDYYVEDAIQIII